MRTRSQELAVGLFVVLAAAALFFLALRVSGLVSVLSSKDSYEVAARFQNIGGLSKNAKVTLSGVTIGKVTNIEIDPKFLNAKVTMAIDSDMNQISDDAYASILTAGLLGEQYIGIEPGANDKYLQNGDEITLTQSALVLEDLISKFVFNKTTENQTGQGQETQNQASDKQSFGNPTGDNSAANNPAANNSTADSDSVAKNDVANTAKAAVANDAFSEDDFGSF